MEKTNRQKMEETSRENNIRRNNIEESLYRDSADRLYKILQKKINTTMIGAISQMEELIGKKLWGHGLNSNECTKEQLIWRNHWERTRTNILNNGNNQIRAIYNELMQYDIKWNRNVISGGTNNE